MTPRVGLGERDTQQIATVFLVCVAVLLWLQGWLPNLTTLLTSGRGYISGLAVTIEQSRSAAGISLALTVGAAGALALAILLGLVRAQAARPVPYLALSICWSILFVIHGPSGVTISTVLFPMSVIAWMLVRPPARVIFTALAWLGVATAAISIGFGLVSSLAFMPAQWTIDADKSLLGGNVLAGPYSHSNALGLSLVLTLPIVVTVLRSRSRIVGSALMLIAIVWSASRLSVAVAAIAMILAIVALRAREQIGRRCLTIVVVAATLLMVLLPILNQNPLLLTNRGAIWIASVRYARDSPLTGHGWDVFRSVNELTTAVGFVSTTGHNYFVTFVVAGGAIAVAVAAAIGFYAVRLSRQMYSVTRTPLLFLAVLTVIGVAEDPIRAFAVGPQSFVVYPMVMALVVAVSSHGEAWSLERDATGQAPSASRHRGESVSTTEVSVASSTTTGDGVGDGPDLQTPTTPIGAVDLRSRIK